MNLAPLLSRKFLVVMTALCGGLALGFVCDAAVVSAFAGLASICVGTYMGAHAVADSKWSKPTEGKDAP